MCVKDGSRAPSGLTSNFQALFMFNRLINFPSYFKYKEGGSRNTGLENSSNGMFVKLQPQRLFELT